LTLCDPQTVQQIQCGNNKIREPYPQTTTFRFRWNLFNVY
jgi:hypothetical protein